MSRSYRKFPRLTVYYGKSGKYSRRLANKKVRRIPITSDLANNSEYRKVYNSYDICDYSFTQFKKWEINHWYHKNSLKCNICTLNECIALWKKRYLCK